MRSPQVPASLVRNARSAVLAFEGWIASIAAPPVVLPDHPVTSNLMPTVSLAVLSVFFRESIKSAEGDVEL
jgi:hypothetical protein